MPTTSETELIERIRHGEKLTTIQATTGVPYSRLMKLRAGVEGSELMNHHATTKVSVGELVSDMAGGEGCALDVNMQELADAVVAKLGTFVDRAEKASDLSYIVDNIAALREAFYGKGASVNIQNNLGMGGGGGSLKDKLKR